MNATNSRYGYMRSDELFCRDANGIDLPAAPDFVFAHAMFRGWIESPIYPCVGAKAVIARNTYFLSLYDRMNEHASTIDLFEDICRFVGDRKTMEGQYRSFIALFRSSGSTDEEEFHSALWRQLQSLHNLDSQLFGWDPAVSSDPDDADFSYSVAGTAFFIIGLHPNSSRTARKFAMAALVFNAHDQFEILRAKGHFEAMKISIRRRDLELQGSLNPNLSDFGETSEARQYSGLNIISNGKCPFKANNH